MPGYSEKEAQMIYQDWMNEFEPPKGGHVIVGGMAQERKDKSPTEERVREIVHEEGGDCDCPGMATNEEFDEMLKVVGLK